MHRSSTGRPIQGDYIGSQAGNTRRWPESGKLHQPGGCKTRVPKIKKLSTKRYKLFDQEGGFLRLCSERQKDSLIALGKVTAHEIDGCIRGLHYRRDDPHDRHERHTGKPSVSNEPHLNTKFTYHEHIEGTTLAIIQHKRPWAHRDASDGCEYFIRRLYLQVQVDCLAKPDFRALAQRCAVIPEKQAA